MKFTHLHLHTQYSLLDGGIRIKSLFDKCKECGHDSVALTDHGTLFGAMHFWDLAKKNDIKPIIGAEVYLTAGSRFDKQKNYSNPAANKLHHLILLIQNETGYHNLCKLITSGYHEGFYYKPRIDHEVLKECNEGLICQSACLAGEVPFNIITNNLEKAWDAAKWHKEIFGDRYYLEIQSNAIPEQKVANEGLIKISKDLNIPLVATNDCHYLNKKDARAHEILLCIQTQKTIADKDRFKLSSDDFYYRSTEEMVELFKDTPEAIANTQEIVERCNYNFPPKTYHLPVVETPDNMTMDEFFRAESLKGLEERWKIISEELRGVGKTDEELSSIKEDYIQRLNYELDIIIKMEFPSYFLIVADFINWAKENDIPVGPGRGSGAGSLVAYSLKITDLDPIPYNLLFERFLNPERVSMPDFDIDFCQDRREEVIEYIRKKYGQEKVGMIITYGSLKARGVIRDVSRAFEVPYSEADRIAKLIPDELNITLDKALEDEPRLRDEMKKDPKINDVVTVARSLEGLYKSAGMHAAGVIIANKPLIEYLPLFKGKQGELVTMFNMEYVEQLGLIKFDFLGLKNLSIIKQAENIIKRVQPDFDINLITKEDKKAYDLYQDGNTLGVFQVESSGMRDLLTKLKPSVFEDVIALVALYRPGPLGSGMVDDFIARKHGKSEITYPFPELEDVLKDTYGVIVYQEQVMRIASELAGFSLGEADILRKAMGKKKLDVMEKMKIKFLEGSKERNHDQEKAAALFDLMAKFAEYGFNKSHAAAYAWISYQTAYLKANHPEAFFAAVLSYEMDNTDKITQYIADAKENGINILPPDINESDFSFSICPNPDQESELKAIRFGLGAIKNVGEAAIDVIINEREKNGKFEDFQDLLTRIDTGKANKRVFEQLVKSGAVDFDGHNRCTLINNLEPLFQFVQTFKEDAASGQGNLFEMIEDENSSPNSYKWLDAEEWDEKLKLAFEKAALGFYASGHPLENYLKLMDQVVTFKAVDAENITAEKKEVIAGGIISACKEIRTKKGKRMAFLTLEDLTGTTEVIVFPEAYETYLDTIKSEEPLFVTGTAEAGEKGVKILVSMPKFDTQNMENNNKKPFQPMKDVNFEQHQTLHLDIDLEDAAEKNIRRLKYLINSNRGTANVVLSININGSATTTLKLPNHYKVNPSTSLIGEIKSLFGREVTRLV